MKEKILKYLKDNMGSEERHSLEHELMRNELMYQIQKNDVLELNKQKKVRRISIKWMHIVVAATILYIVGSAILIMLPSVKLNDKIYASYYHKYKTDNTIASRLNYKNRDFINVINSFNKNNYKETITKLQKIIEFDTTNNTSAYFLLGISFMEMQNYQEAIKKFLQVIGENDSFNELAEWYLALCYLKTDQTSDAVILLNDLASHHYYQSNAEKILKKLNRYKTY
jgi:tetratricopeptide (TPR) repeat protein